MMEFGIEPMREADWSQVANIYLDGIKTGLATFQTTVPTWKEWDCGHLKECRLVARREHLILGWCALSPTSSKEYYKGVVEVSIYIADGFKGHGVGTRLLQELIKQSEQYGIWTLYSGIIGDNTASLLLHKKCGFREIGYREKVGKMNGQKWMDVVIMERRSSVAGVD